MAQRSRVTVGGVQATKTRQPHGGDILMLVSLLLLSVAGLQSGRLRCSSWPKIWCLFMLAHAA